MERLFHKKRVLSLAALVLLFGLLSSMTSCLVLPSGSGSESSNQDSSSVFSSLPPDTEFYYATKVSTPEAAGTVAEAVDRVAGAVVEIETETVSSYFGQSYTSAGAGSGVIISKNGCIITCYHVIQGCTNVYVYTNDGTQYTATVVGYDQWSDLALLKIEATKDLPYVTFATAETGKHCVVPGEQVVAIGNPLGYLGGSVTVGCISATSRSVMVEGFPMTLLQTDAAVSPGNSGGGLFNLNGQLVGIVNAKLTVEGAENLGFAIPSTEVLSVADQLAQKGYVSGRPFLGMSFSSSSSGLTISGYQYNSELAVLNPTLGDFTIQNGDVLAAIDGTRIDSVGRLHTVLSGKKVGDTVTATIHRVSGRNIFNQYTYDSYDIVLRIHERTV